MPRTVTVHRFRDDPMFPAVEHSVAAILAQGKVVAPVDVMVPSTHAAGWFDAGGGVARSSAGRLLHGEASTLQRTCP